MIFFVDSHESDSDASSDHSELGDGQDGRSVASSSRSGRKSLKDRLLSKVSKATHRLSRSKNRGSKADLGIHVEQNSVEDVLEGAVARTMVAGEATKKEEKPREMEGIAGAGASGGEETTNSTGDSAEPVADIGTIATPEPSGSATSSEPSDNATTGSNSVPAGDTGDAPQIVPTPTEDAASQSSPEADKSAQVSGDAPDPDENPSPNTAPQADLASQDLGAPPLVDAASTKQIETEITESAKELAAPDEAAPSLDAPQNSSRMSTIQESDPAPPKLTRYSRFSRQRDDLCAHAPLLAGFVEEGRILSVKMPPRVSVHGRKKALCVRTPQLLE